MDVSVCDGIIDCPVLGIAIYLGSDDLCKVAGSKGYKIRSGVEKIPLLIFVKNKQNQNDFIKTYVDK